MNNDLLDVITVPTLDLDRALQIADLALALGRVDRATRHPDGVRPETDTDHTLMLVLLAVDVASTLYDVPSGRRPILRPDLRKVILFALVHDLVEAYAGDVVSIDLTEEQRAEKARREAAALDRIRADLPGWIPSHIESYERQDCMESRLVHYLDKVVPKLTHALNGGAALEQLGLTPNEASEHNRTQGARLAAKNPDLVDVASLFDRAHLACIHEYVSRLEGAASDAEARACPCDGCSQPAVTRSPDDVPLCGECASTIEEPDMPDHPTAAEPAPPLDDRIRVALALFDDEEAEIGEEDVLPLLEEALHATLERRDLESCLDRIRATCEAAGIPGETREPDPDHPDDRTEDITTKWSTDKLVERLAAELAGERQAVADAHELTKRLRDRVEAHEASAADHAAALERSLAIARRAGVIGETERESQEVLVERLADRVHRASEYLDEVVGERRPMLRDPWVALRRVAAILDGTEA